MADLATLQAWLVEAEAARHALATGARVVEVSKDGDRMAYQAGNAGQLDTYAADLRVLIAELQNPLPASLPRRRFIPTAMG